MRDKLIHQLNVRINDPQKDGIERLKSLGVDTQKWVRQLIERGLEESLPKTEEHQSAS